mgnify:CR=1 FL=1
MYVGCSRSNASDFISMVLWFNSDVHSFPLLSVGRGRELEGGVLEQRKAMLAVLSTRPVSEQGRVREICHGFFAAYQSVVSLCWSQWRLCHQCECICFNTTMKSRSHQFFSSCLLHLYFLSICADCLCGIKMLIMKSRLNLNSLKFKCAWMDDFNTNFIFYGNIVVSRLRFFFYCRTKNI